MKLDLSTLPASTVLSLQQSEKKIIEYKNFYKTYLIKLKNRDNVLNELQALRGRFQKSSPHLALTINVDTSSLDREITLFLKENFNTHVVNLYNKELPLRVSESDPSSNKPLFTQILTGLSATMGAMSEKNKQEWNFKLNFLNFLYSCISHYGLHPNILLRNKETDKRFNIKIVHYFKSKAPVTELRILTPFSTLLQEYLAPYEKQLTFKINGKLIPFKDVYQVQITSTLLQDDEIELFGLQNKFRWSSSIKETERFAECCLDETEELLKNPFLLEQNSTFRNQHSHFVHLKRIEEIKNISKTKFDLLKLVQLCEELNIASVNSNHLSSSLLVRAIIDHIPPIFGYSNFSEVANNYSGGTKSFKKSMINLNILSLIIKYT